MSTRYVLRCRRCGHRHRRHAHVAPLGCCRCGADLVLLGPKRAKKRLVLYLSAEDFDHLGEHPVGAALFLIESALATKRRETRGR